MTKLKKTKPKVCRVCGKVPQIMARKDTDICSENCQSKVDHGQA